MQKIVIECFLLNAANKDHLFQLFCHKQVQLPLDQTDQRHVQLDHGCYQVRHPPFLWAASPCKKILPYVQSKPILYQFKPITPHSIFTDICKIK